MKKKRERLRKKLLLRRTQTKFFNLSKLYKIQISFLLMLKEQLLNKEEQEKACKELIEFFRSERDEDIGIIAAQNLLDFILEEIGGEIYNKGVENSLQVLEKKNEDLSLELETLKFSK